MRIITALPITLTIILSIVVVFSVSGFSIEDEVRITETSYQEWGPKMAVDRDGYSHMLYRISTNESLEYRKVSPNGQTVVGPLMIIKDDMKMPTYGDIKIDDSNQIHIAFFSYHLNETGRDIIYCQLDMDGHVIVPPRWVSNSTTYSSHVNMDIDGRGNIYMVWREMSDPQEIQWCNLSAVGTLVPPVTVSRGTTQEVEVHRPKISVDPRGESHVFWQMRSNTDSPWRLFYSRLSPSGDVLNTPSMLIRSRETDCSLIKVHLEENVGVHTVFIEYGQDGWLATYALVTSDGNLEESWPIIGPFEEEIEWVDIVITSKGDRVFAFVQWEGSDKLLTSIGVCIVSQENNATRSFDITGFEFFEYVPDMDYASERTVVCFVRDGDIYQRVVNTSDPNYPPTPVLSSDSTSAVVNEWITFSGNRSHDPDEGDTLAGYLFDWGDGTATEWQVSNTEDHKFTKPGVYTVSLSVQDNHGLTSEETVSVIIVVEEPNIKTSDESYFWLIIIILILIVLIALLTRNTGKGSL
jgi:hypothetical protein